MNDTDHDDDRLRTILRAEPAPISTPSFEELAARRPRTSLRGSTAITFATVVVAVAALVAGQQLSEFRQRQATPSAGVGAATSANPSAAPHITLPQPIPQAVTRTSAAAQVAWVGAYLPGGNGAGLFLGIDPTGKLVGRLDVAGGPYWRSADGAHLVAVGDEIIEYSARDGTVERSYGASTGRAVDVAFSPDGRWLAFIGLTAFVEIVDLQSGLSQLTPLGHSSTSFAGSGSTLVFSSDSSHLYTIVDWAGPVRLTAFDVTPTGLVQTRAAIDGQQGRSLPPCGGPGIAPKVIGTTLVVFCHVDGSVAFIDLTSLTSVAVVHAVQPNPFWLSPIFTPDGHLLYLHQIPAFGDQMQVIDIPSRALLGPVPTPKALNDPGPFAWLLPVAYAGGVASTVPLSPDGLKLYDSASDGITVLRVPDLKPIAKLASGVSLDEVWISGDGRTLFASDGVMGLYVIPEAGGVPIQVKLPDQIGGFIASEHG